MTVIDHIKQLPWLPLRSAYTVRTEADALERAAGHRCWLFKQTETAWYIFVESE